MPSFCRLKQEAEGLSREPGATTEALGRPRRVIDRPVRHHHGALYGIIVTGVVEMQQVYPMASTWPCILISYLLSSAVEAVRLS